MSDEADVHRQFETVWSELKLLLEWKQGFAFYLVFGDDHRVSSQLKQRLADYVQSRTWLMQWVRPERLENVVADVLAAVFPTGDQARYADRHAPLWIELTANPGNEAWDAARHQALAALNRQRSSLERNFARPLFVQLPLDVAPQVVTSAADLWSIREYIALLPAARAGLEGVPHDELRQRSSALDDIGAAELEQGRLDAALTAYRESLEIGRQLRTTLGDTPQALRDLSISLIKVGEAERDSGRVDAALTAYRESLEIGRHLRATLGDTPQALRDLSISLDNVGEAERDSGRVDAALTAYRESLEIRRQLRATLGETPQALRDLAYVTNQLSAALAVAGNAAEAQELSQQWSQLQQRLEERLAGR